jgi:hypothetical protein
MFAQVIVGLGDGGRDIADCPIRTPGRFRMMPTERSANCLTLMHVVTVRFLTVTKGHVGQGGIPSA